MHRILFALAASGFLLHSAIPAMAQTFDDPQDADGWISDVRIRRGNRLLNQDEDQIAYVGVEECRDLVDRRIEFFFSRSDQYDTEFLNAHLMEFEAAGDLPGVCNQDSKTGCTRLQANTGQDIRITDNEDAVAVSMEFDVLRTLNQEELEECEFTNSSQQTMQQGQTQADAGITNDTGTTPGEGDADDFTDTDDDTSNNDTSGITGEDTAYLVRIFLEVQRQTNPLINNSSDDDDDVEFADGLLILDRTRPPRPASVDAGATEHLMIVEWTPPEGTRDINNYHVFVSSDPIDSSATPEELNESDAVDRFLLKSPREQDGGEFRFSVEDFSGQSGDEVYIAVASRDQANNFSEVRPRSEPITVQRSVDFWEKYQEAGGLEEGGGGCACSTSSDSTGRPVGLLLGLLAAGFGGRMGRRLTQRFRR